MKMSSTILAGVSALALVLAAPAASFAQHRMGGGGAHFSGGGAHFSGGGFSGARVGAGPSFSGARVTASPTTSFAAAPSARIGTAPAFTGGRVATTGPAFTGSRVATWNGGNWHGGRFHHHNRFFPGFAAGAIAGAALGSYAYYDDPYYYNDPYYYDDGGAVVVSGGGDPSYCAQRYRSYDPASGTYLGYDGLRHPCP